MTFSIRKASAADRQDWAALRFRLWDSLPLAEHLLDIDRMLAEKLKRGGWIARDEGGAALGFAEFSIRDYANGCEAQPVPFLEGIWIAPKARRRGVGRALLEAMTAEFRAQGFREICSDAGIRNRASHKAHAGWGFSETERVVYFRKPI